MSGVIHSESSCMKCPRYEPTSRAKGSLKAKELKYDTILKYVCENNTFSPNIVSLFEIAQSHWGLFWISSAQRGPPTMSCLGLFQVALGHLQGWSPNDIFGQPVLLPGHLHNASVSWCSDGASSVSLCAHWFLSWVPLKERLFFYLVCSDL